MYLTLFPCSECCKAIIQAGIKEIIFLAIRNSEKPEIGKLMLTASKIPYRMLDTTRSPIFEINLEKIAREFMKN
jgi:dCMP deaminase